MRYLFSLLLFAAYCSAHAQPYLHKQWDKRYGGGKKSSYGDFLSDLLYTSKGEIILVGHSYSDNDGNKSQPNWDTTFQTSDGYIVKLDINGNKIWDKRFGGTDLDWFKAGVVTKNNYIVLAGITYSGTNGDVSDFIRGADDYWMVKIDSNGNKIWDKRFGGTNNEYLTSIIETRDGGYLLGGRSYSSVGYDKTEPNRTPTGFAKGDYWIVKTDSAGNKQWDKTFGGTKSETLWEVLQTRDGGYLLGGTSTSRNNGDKTQDNWDTINNPETADVWLVKIDSTGNKLWDKRYGTTGNDGFKSMIETLEGDIILGCGAAINNGDKTTTKEGPWIIKINIVDGSILYQVSYQLGSALSSVYPTNDGGYLFSGEGFRTDRLVNNPFDRTEDCLGPYNTVVLKLDSNLNKEWDRTIFTTGSDNGGYAVQTNDGCYVVANTSKAGIGGYKTQAAWDSTFDMFILKFCMEDTISSVNEITTQNGIGLSVYPNPFTDNINITVTGTQEATFTITDITGKTIYTTQETNLANTYTKSLDIPQLPSGMYYVTVISKQGTVTKQIVKQ